MKTVLVDGRMPENMSAALASLGVSVKRMPLCGSLDQPVAGHPDLLAALLPDGALLLSRSYYDTAAHFFDSLGCRIRLTEERLSSRYPYDVLFDALAVGDTLYGKPEAVSRILRSAYRRMVPVRQGYARCSVALFSPNAAVTSDPGLADRLRKDGLDVLEIMPGHIELPGYSCGFIGGAGGLIQENLYVFFGNPDRHPDGERIRVFAERQKISAVSLTDEPLCDCGGLLVLP